MGDEIKTEGSNVSTDIAKKVAPAASSLSFLGGPLVGAAGSIAGGLISNLFNKGSQKKAEDFQRELAQHGISWRVQDAKNAGIHPLFALGAQIPMANPMVLGDSLGESISRAGQYVGNAMSQQMTESEKMAQWASYRAATSQAERNEAEGQYFNALTAKIIHDMGNEAPSPLGIQPEKGASLSGQVPNVPGGSEGLVNVKAVDQPTQKRGFPGVQSGLYEGMQEVRIRPGLSVLMPALEGESWIEHYSEMSIFDKIGLLNRNAAVYGDTWVRDFLDYYYKGKEPSHNYTPLSERGKNFKQVEPGPWYKRWWRETYEPAKGRR